MAPFTEEQLDRFRRGEEYRGPVDKYLVDGQPDEESLRILGRALRIEKEPVREQIAKLLVAMGRKLDPLFSEGGDLIRDRRIVSILVERGLAKNDPVRDYCFDVLQQSVSAPLLREFGAELSANLQSMPDGTALLVVAKAKPPEAIPVIDSLIHTAEWKKEKETPIAMAALGDKELERKYLHQFMSTHDPEKKGDLAEELGWIGTQGALHALASEMRTNLIIEMPMVLRKSVRVNIIAALSYNYPTETFLWDNAVDDDSGYARIEKFCEETFGVTWKTPRPPFLWIEGIPSAPGE